MKFLHPSSIYSVFSGCGVSRFLQHQSEIFFRHLLRATATASGVGPTAYKVVSSAYMWRSPSEFSTRSGMSLQNREKRIGPSTDPCGTPNLTVWGFDLIKEDNMFQLRKGVEGRCLELIKNAITTSPVLKYFDPHHAVELQCDASQKGLGACLLQGGQPVAYASRSLTETELQYAQIEKEMLAIVFGAERFEQFVYRRKVRVESDHKPLESILKKSILSAPKSLQRMMLRLQKFDLEVEYKKGAHMYLADTLSRAYLPHTYRCREDREDVWLLEDSRGEAEKEVERINMLHDLAVSEEMLETIKQATEADPSMERLQSTITQWTRFQKTSETIIPSEMSCHYRMD